MLQKDVNSSDDFAFHQWPVPDFLFEMNKFLWV